MAGLTKRAEGIELWSSLGEKAWAVAIWALPGGVGFLTGWIARATQWLGAYGPLSWIFAGLLSATLVASTFWLITFGLRQAAHWRYIRDVLRPVDGINPLDNIFTRKRILFADLHNPLTGPIKEKTFAECELIGPAIIVARDCTFAHVTFRACDWIQSRPGAQISNAILLEKVVFTGGKIVGATIYGDAQMRANLADGNWVT